MTEIDSAAFEAGEESCNFSQDNLSASGSSTAAHFSETLGRVYVTARARLLSARPQPGHTQPALTVVVEDSADGSSWATVATFTFTASDEQPVAVDSPRAYLRASWTGVVGVWAVDVDVKSLAAPSSGGGGSTTFTGVRVSLGADADWGGGGTLPFDHVSIDPDGYWDAVNHKAVIPAGKAGMYRASFQLYVAANAAITSGLVILEANDPDPVLGGGFDFPFVKYAHNGIWLAWGTADVYGHEADNIFLDGGMFGVDPSTVTAGCYFGLTYLGPTDSVPA